jgi:hypothetical protein
MLYELGRGENIYKHRSGPRLDKFLSRTVRTAKQKDHLIDYDYLQLTDTLLTESIHNKYIKTKENEQNEPAWIVVPVRARQEAKRSL